MWFNFLIDILIEGGDECKKIFLLRYLLNYTAIKLSTHTTDFF